MQIVSGIRERPLVSDNRTQRAVSPRRLSARPTRRGTPDLPASAIQRSRMRKKNPAVRYPLVCGVRPGHKIESWPNNSLNSERHPRARRIQTRRPAHRAGISIASVPSVGFEWVIGRTKTRAHSFLVHRPPKRSPLGAPCRLRHGPSRRRRPTDSDTVPPDRAAGVGTSRLAASPPSLRRRATPPDAVSVRLSKARAAAISARSSCQAAGQPCLPG